jgi:hypothetical protein
MCWSYVLGLFTPSVDSLMPGLHFAEGAALWKLVGGYSSL